MRAVRRQLAHSCQPVRAARPRRGRRRPDRQHSAHRPALPVFLTAAGAEGILFGYYQLRGEALLTKQVHTFEFVGAAAGAVATALTPVKRSSRGSEVVLAAVPRPGGGMLVAAATF